MCIRNYKSVVYLTADILNIDSAMLLLLCNRNAINVNKNGLKS